MSILLIFAFISGLATIAAPCIWPLLPIILSSTTTGGHRKPLGITLGIMTSFAFFTLTISYIVKIIPFDPNVLRLFAVIVIGFLGLTLIIPQLFGVVMILTALAIFTNYDKVLQAKLLDAFPSYSNFLYQLEGQEGVKKQLDELKKNNQLPTSQANLNIAGLNIAPEFAGITKRNL